jgi:hypothetical protein
MDNLMTSNNKSGRPPKFSKKEDLQSKGDQFFKLCEDNKKPKTICGLTLALGFKSRDTLYEYEKKPLFSDTIKRLRLKCEEYYEERLSANNPTGAIFALKNMDWKDKQENSVFVEGLEASLKAIAEKKSKG